MNSGTGLDGKLMGMSSIDCKAAITSNAAKAIGKAVANQLVESGANIATDALMGNDVNESVYRELKNTKQNAAAGVENLKRGLQCKKTSSGFKNFKSHLKSSYILNLSLTSVLQQQLFVLHFAAPFA